MKSKKITYLRNTKAEHEVPQTEQTQTFCHKCQNTIY